MMEDPTLSWQTGGAVTFDLLTAERVAHNEDAFRKANDRILDRAEEVARHVDVLPFLCECPERDCTEIARLRRDEYLKVRESGRTFLVVPGHEVVSVDGLIVARLVEAYENFSMMEKVHETGEIAEELDNRGGD